MDKELSGKIKSLIQKKKSFAEVCEMLELKDYELIGLVSLMKQDGELIDYVNGEIIHYKKPIENNNVYEIPNNLETLKILLISDTHLVNKADRLDILRYLYDKAEKLKIKHILHSGDILDGMYTNRPQQIFELRKHGFDEHLEYCVDKYPRFDGKTYFVGGNHLETYIRNGGSDMGKAIAKERDDLIYLNPDTADLKIGNLKVRMHHGGGGRAYSLSYKLQRYAETVNVNDRPHIITQGHFHNAFYMNYQDMHCFQVGALMDETQFSRSLGFKNEKSCWWVNVQMDKNGNPLTIEPTLESFEGNKKLVKRK